MKLWKYTPLDCVMLALSVSQFGLTFWVAARWESWSYAGRAGSFALLVFMMTYNIIVLSHLFTHAAWFSSPLLNGLVSALNSVNIGQSVQAYQLTHVRNHHRYNNDRKGPDGKTKDASSTYQDGVDGEHAGLFRYAFVGAAQTLMGVVRALLSAVTLWRVRGLEPELLALASKTPSRRARELRQIRLDRAAHLLALFLFVFVSWKWALLCYLPAFYLALALVNVQNYYEHYGARPGNSYSDSVSYYGRIYNMLAFNDGYHQEHHLRPQAHWSSMRFVRSHYRDELDRTERVVSPVPAILGFLHRNRPLLHRHPAASAVAAVVAPPPPETLHERDDAVRDDAVRDDAAAAVAGSLAHE